MTNSSPILVAINLLDPHQQNPRLIQREDITAQLAEQIKKSSFQENHAILIRPLNDRYQIISGHRRTEAARRAGLAEIPAWVREMTDEEAYMELVLSNTQTELTPLERGFHALRATEGGNRGISSYAEAVGRPQSSVQLEVQAARVADYCTCNKADLVHHTRALAEIHGTPQSCWPTLVGRMVDGRWTVTQTIREVKTVMTVKPPRGHEKLFAVERLQELLADGKKVEEITGNLVRNIERARADLHNGFNSDVYLERFDSWLAEHGPWDELAVFTKKKELAEEQTKEKEEAERKAPQLKRAVTLTEWKTLSPAEAQALCRTRDVKAKLTKQDSDSIEFAHWRWHPVTGCNHNCPFEPSLVSAALAAPLNMMPPKEAESDPSYKNIFVCSMADLFGNWVPREWVENVLSIQREATWWNFLMLTKFPQRLKEFEFPENAWLGTTVDLQARVRNAEEGMRAANARVKWLSIEPLIEPLVIDFSLFNWVVIGGASKSTETPEWKPPRDWVEELTLQARRAGCAVYHKANLNLDPLRDYPGFRRNEPTRAPEQFHYLKSVVPSDLITLEAGPKPDNCAADDTIETSPTSAPGNQLELYPGSVPLPVINHSMPDSPEAERSTRRRRSVSGR